MRSLIAHGWDPTEAQDGRLVHSRFLLSAKHSAACTITVHQPPCIPFDFAKIPAMPPLCIRTVLSILAFFATCSLHAQAPQKLPVKFTCTCSDPVGARYATALRDLIAASPRYTASSDYVVGKGDDEVWHWGIRVVSLDPTVGKLGDSTVLSVTLTFGNLYVDAVVQSCLADSPKHCAEDTLSSLDGDIAELSKK